MYTVLWPIKLSGAVALRATPLSPCL